MDMLDVHYIAIYGDLIATKVQGCVASSEPPQYRSYDIRKDLNLSSIYRRIFHLRFNLFLAFAKLICTIEYCNISYYIPIQVIKCSFYIFSILLLKK